MFCLSCTVADLLGLKILYLWYVGNAADMISLVFRLSGGLGTYSPRHFILTSNEYF